MRDPRCFRRRSQRKAAVLTAVLAMTGVVASTYSLRAEVSAPGARGVAYIDMPVIAPIGVRVDRYMEVPESAKGPPIDGAKGCRTQELGPGLYMITDNVYQSMFMVYETGVVVVYAPPSYSEHIVAAIRDVTDKPITHLVYSHSHKDHIGGANDLRAKPIIIAQEETKALLVRAGDPLRPAPSVTFRESFTLKVGSQILELSYHGNAHEPGNIFIFAPAQKTLMVVDIIFPGWMPWRRLALAQDIEGYYAQVAEMNRFDFDTLVAGHVSRTGTREDVKLQSEFLDDLKATVAKAMKATQPGEGIDPHDQANPYAVFDNYIDRVVIRSVNDLTPRWSERLAGFDVFIWDQCYAMEESLSLD